MIYLIIGENVFKRDQEVAKLTDGRDVERYDGSDLIPERLGEVLAGQTLFASDTVTIIDGASLNKPVWEALETWLSRAGDLEIIFLEQKPDKRTKTYKVLQKQATIITCDYWSDRQRPVAAKWLGDYAKDRGVKLPSELINDLVERSIRPSDTSDKAVIDQQRLARAIEQLEHTRVIDRNLLDTVLAPSVQENVFALLTRALDGDVVAVREMTMNLRHDQDGHRVMGLLSSQLSHLVGLVLGGDQSPEQVASDIGAHPFALKQLVSYRAKLGRRDIAQMVRVLADADVRLKVSQAEPWVMIEKALVEIAMQRKTPAK